MAIDKPETSNSTFVTPRGGKRYVFEAGRYYPQSFMCWLYPDATSNNWFFGTRTSGGVERHIFSRVSGTQIQIRDALSTSVTTSITHSRPGEWLLVLGRYILQGDTEILAFALDGTEWSSSTTTSGTDTSNIEFAVFRDEDVDVQNACIWNCDIQPSEARQVMRGMNPATLHPDHIIFYQPMEARFNEYNGSSIPIASFTSPTRIVGRPVSPIQTIPLWAPSILDAGGDTYTFSPNSLQVTSQLDAPTLTQNHVITPAELTVSGALDSASLVQNHILAPVDGEVSSQLDATSVDVNHVLSPAGAEVSSQLDGATMTQNHVLSPADGSVTSQLDQSGVTEEGDDHTFSPDDGSVSSVLDAATMTQNHVLSPNDGSVTVQLDASSMTQVHVITPADLAVTSQLDTTSLDFSVILEPADLSVSSTLDATSINQVHILSPADGSVVATLDTSSITQVHILSPVSLEVTSVLDTATLVLPSGVVRATISLGSNYSGSVSLGSPYSGSTSLGSFS